MDHKYDNFKVLFGVHKNKKFKDTPMEWRSFMKTLPWVNGPLKEYVNATA